MHVLLTTDAIGGVWTYSLELACSLQRQGLRVTLAALGPPPDHSARVQARMGGICLVQLDAQLDWLAENPAQIKAAAKAIAEAALTAHADLIQLHSPSYLAFGAMPVPAISVVHSCMASWWAAVRATAIPDDLIWRSDVMERGLNAAALNVAPTAAFATTVSRLYGCEIPVAVHNARTPPQGRARSSTEDFVFTSGRLWDEAKGFSCLDEAARDLGMQVLAAGATQSPFGGKIVARHANLMGPLDAAEIAKHLRRRPIFCAPALYEPFGLSILEAAQAGCALVLSAIPTLREVWDGAALFVPPRDPSALHSALRALAVDRDWRLTLGEAARRRSGTFVPERQAASMVGLYARALGLARLPEAVA